MFLADDATVSGVSRWTVGDDQTGAGQSATMLLMHNSFRVVLGAVHVMQNGTLNMRDFTVSASEIIVVPGATRIAP